MSNEKYNQIIDEIYEKYHQENKHVMYLTFLLKEEFIRRCKTDSEFSKKWGLKIEERELNIRDRLIKFVGFKDAVTAESVIRLKGEEFHKKKMDENNIPTKLITVTYKDEKIEVYE